MAKTDSMIGRNIKESKSPGPQGNSNVKSKTNGFAFGLLAVLTAILIMAAVIGGAFYIVINNNVNGLAVKHRKDIQGIPLLRMALPIIQNPDDLQFLTDQQIRERYTSLLSKKDELAKQLETAAEKIDVLDKIKDGQDKVMNEAEVIRKEAEDKAAQTEAQKKQLEDDKKKFDILVASSNKTGFKDFFEKMDKENAKKMYADILQEQKVSDDIKKFVQIYESMDGAAAAKIFEQMGTSKLDMVVNILKNMNRQNAAEILGALDPAFSSKVSDRLYKVITESPEKQ